MAENVPLTDGITGLTTMAVPHVGW